MIYPSTNKQDYCKATGEPLLVVWVKCGSCSWAGWEVELEFDKTGEAHCPECGCGNGADFEQATTWLSEGNPFEAKEPSE